MRALLIALILPAALLAAQPNPAMLVSPDWLAQHLHDQSLVILHVGSQTDYNAGHIPGARLLTLADISITGATGLRLELPPVSDLEKAFGRLGVADGSRIVLYTGNDSVQSATRVWFTLDYLGAGARAALLDGGLKLWRAAGRPLSTVPEAGPSRQFTAHVAGQPVATAEWVHQHLGDAQVQLLDARLPEFYSGASAGGMPRAGHIPGARSVPFSSVLNENGTLKSVDSLRSLVKDAPLTVSYCHIGQQASVLYFVARYLGQNARLYDGSFQEWSRTLTLPVQSDVASQLDAIFSPLAGAKSPGLAVLVRNRGGSIFARGYGVRDSRSLAPIDEHTNFRLASFTKQFTAMAVMLLVHDGKLQYDRPLTEIFPDFPPYGRAITVRQLLTHTAGLKDYEDLMGAGWTESHQIPDSEVFNLLKRQTAGKFAPGTSWQYSNSGYVILGLIVAKVSGQPFAQFLHDRIFQPLHMDDTLLYVNGVNTVPNRAYGNPADQSSTSATQGDGGIYSNLADLAKWDDALDKNTLLSEPEMTPALTPVKLANGAAAQPYGFGWFLDPYQGRPRMWHYGSTSGFGTAIERFPADQLTVIVLCNRTDLDPQKLALQAAALIFR